MRDILFLLLLGCHTYGRRELDRKELDGPATGPTAFIPVSSISNSQFSIMGENIWIIEPVNFHVHDISKTISFNHIHTRLPFSLVISRMLAMTLILVMMQTGIAQRSVRSKGFTTSVRVILRLRVLLS